MLSNIKEFIKVKLLTSGRLSLMFPVIYKWNFEMKTIIWKNNFSRKKHQTQSYNPWWVSNTHSTRSIISLGLRCAHSHMYVIREGTLIHQSRPLICRLKQSDYVLSRRKSSDDESIRSHPSPAFFFVERLNLLNHWKAIIERGVAQFMMILSAPLSMAFNEHFPLSLFPWRHSADESWWQCQM